MSVSLQDQIFRKIMEENDMLIKIGTIIKKLRLENDITQDMLANAIGITPQAISRWESEVAYPDIELLPQIADYFSVSID